MRDDACETAHRLHPLGLAQRGLQAGPFRHVDHLGDDPDGLTPFVSANGGMDLDEELGAVSSGRADQVRNDDVTGHCPGNHVDQRGFVAGRRRGKLDRSPEDLGRGQAEERLGRLIPCADRHVAFDRHRGHGRGRHERREEAGRGGEILLGHDTGGDLPIRGIERRGPSVAGAPDQSERERCEEREANDGEARLAHRVRLVAQGEQDDRDGRHDPSADIDQLGCGPAEIRLDDADPDERDDDGERHADRVQPRGQKGLRPEQHDREHQQQAVAALVDRDQDQDGARDDRRLQGDGQDRLARRREVQRDGSHDERGNAASEEEAPESRALAHRLVSRDGCCLLLGHQCPVPGTLICPGVDADARTGYASRAFRPWVREPFGASPASYCLNAAM